MSKRNLILLIILLAILSTVGIILIFSYGKFSLKEKTTVEDVNFVSTFFPFGKTTKTTPQEEPAIDVPQTDTPVSNFSPNLNNKLRKVSGFIISGYGIFSKERFKEIPQAPTLEISTESTSPILNKKTKPEAPLTEFVPAIRYVEKTTGNIYQSFADTLDERRFSEVLIPNTYDSYFGQNGESVLMRYLKNDNKTIESFIASLPKEVLGADIIENNNLKSSFLPENTFDLCLSRDGSKLFYLFNINNNALGIYANGFGDKKNQVFSSPFTEWLSSCSDNKVVILTTKPSYATRGYSYSINTDTKNFTKVLDNVLGLTTLISPDGRLLLYSDNTLSLNILNIKEKTTIFTATKTLAEKCTWNSSSTSLYCAVPKYKDGNEYPDLWYMGETSFSDEIWKIDAINGNAALITDPSQLPSGEDTDGIRLNVDTDENYLFFINKKNNSLWELVLQ